MKLSIVLVTIAILVGTGSALQCYVCSSVAGVPSGCGSGSVASSNLQTCSSGTSTSCSKVSVTVSGSETVTRACSSTSSTTCSSASLLGITSNTCYCQTDGCNSANRSLPSLAALLFVSLLAAAFRFA